MAKPTVTAIVGGQYGSEGKGAVARDLAFNYDIHVRTGGPNAGHTIFHEGRVWKMQSIPCGWTNPHAVLVIGRAAVVNPRILLNEVAELEAAGYHIRNRLYVDTNAIILTPTHELVEGHTDGELHQLIGSTGEGVGAARHGWMARDASARVFAAEALEGSGIKVLDTLTFMDTGCDILLEGTQGFGLSLVHGTWPYVTSRDTTAGQLAVDAGVPPSSVKHVVMVVRTFPIRVAGKSGPLPNETTWEHLSQDLKRRVIEKTTVTQKVRRVAEYDPFIVKEAARINGATEIVLTFADYLHPDNCQAGWYDLSPETKRFVRDVEEDTGVRVTRVGTGFNDQEGWSSTRPNVTRHWAQSEWVMA